MAASGTRERRPAVWPWLVMPLVVLLAFYALRLVQQGPAPAPAPPPPPQAAPAAPADGQ
jgi:hypothetical protein